LVSKGNKRTRTAMDLVSKHPGNAAMSLTYKGGTWSLLECKV
jgi:hypothetical protein